MNEQQIKNMVSETVEGSVSAKMNKLSRTLITIFLGFFAVLMAFLIGNAYWMGQVDSKNETLRTEMTEFIIEQRKLNKEQREANSKITDESYELEKNLNKQLDAISQNQLIVVSNMKRLDPTFEIPIIIRGGVINNNNNKGF